MIVERYINAAPVPEGCSRNSKLIHGVRIQPAPNWIEGVLDLQKRPRGSHFSFTDCPYEESFTIIWLAAIATDEDLEEIRKLLETKAPHDNY